METELIYKDQDLAGKTPTEVADIIVVWRNDDDQLASAAFDLLNAIETWCRKLGIE